MKLTSLVDIRVVVVVAWLIVIAAVIAFIGPGNVLSSYSHVTPQSIRDVVGGYGALSGIAFVAASLARPFFFLPATPFTIASGFLFGFWPGLAWSFAGTTLCAVLTFFLSRYLLRSYILRRYGERLRHIDRALEDRGWSYVAFARLIPVVPFDLVSYAAGASGISFREYMIGTVVGEMPAAIVLVMLGSTLDNLGSPAFYLSLLLAVAILAGPEIFRRWVKRRKEKLSE